MSADGDGFHLNGEPLALHGTNRHQDHAGLGNALPDAYHRRDVQIVKDTGFNFLRLAHYPQDPAVLDATDALGLAVWEEIPVVNTITMSEAFAANAERMLVEMIRQHYNHPSVVMWGYMNEVLLRMPDPTPEGYVAAVRGLAERLDAIAKREDPHRLTAMAFSNGEVVMDSGMQDIADVFGMNLYFGWYYDDFAALGTFLDSLHTAHPDRPLMISEYGAGTDERVHSAAPRAFDFSVEYGAAFHRSSFAQILARAYLVGSAVWNQFDFGSNHRQDTKNALNQKGLLLLRPHAEGHRATGTAPSSLTSRCCISSASTRTAHRASGEATQPVSVYSNAARVTLRANGEPCRLTRLPWNNGLTVFESRSPTATNEIEAMEGCGTTAQTRTDAVTIHFDDRRDCLTRPGPVRRRRQRGWNVQRHRSDGPRLRGRPGVALRAEDPSPCHRLARTTASPAPISTRSFSPTARSAPSDRGSSQAAHRRRRTTSRSASWSRNSTNPVGASSPSLSTASP